MQSSFPTQAQLHTVIHGVGTFVAALPRVVPYAVVLAAGVSICCLMIILAVRFASIRRLLKREMAFLELTPPAYSDTTPQAGQQLFADLHGLETIPTVMDKLLERRIVFSAEVVGTRVTGIRFVFCVPSELRSSFERTIHAFDPDIRIRETEDYLERHQASERLVEFGLKSRYYPLAAHESYEMSDPMAYLLSAFNGLQEGETIALQLVLTPARVRRAERIGRRILHHHEHMEAVGKRRRRSSGILAEMLFGLSDGIGSVFHGSSGSGLRSDESMTQHRRHVAEGIKPARTMGAIEARIAQEVSEKLSQPLYRVNIRAYVAGGDTAAKVNGLRKSFSVYRTQYQAIVQRPDFWHHLRIRYRLYLMMHRLPGLLYGTASILSTSEIASIYHIPNGQSGDVVKSLSKVLPAPLGLRNRADSGAFDVLLGTGTHHGDMMGIGLTAEERERHVFIVGGTGNGKSTLMKYSILQDIKNGKGVAVLDPHGDLAQEILTYVPEDRVKDVIYFNPADLNYPIGLNILEVPEGLAGDELLDAKDFVAETVVSIMRKTFSDDGEGGHRIEYVLRNAVLAALTVKDATLFTVYDILTNSKYRQNVVRRLEEEWLRNFWTNEFGKAGGYQQVKMMAGVTSKIGRYHASVSAGRILSQPKSTISFDEILDGKILICNLAKGLIGEDTSEVLGIAMLAELQLAAYRRIKQKKAERKPFYTYVDEFQNFATTSFVEMLSEARKYELFLTMAEQTTSQQDDERTVNTILANAGTIVCFKTNSLADEQQMLHLFEPYLEKGQLASLPAYTFYAKLSGGLEPQEPLSGRTVLLDEEGREDIAEVIIQTSRSNYAREYVAPQNSREEQSEDESDVTERAEDEGGGELQADAGHVR